MDRPTYPSPATAILVGGCVVTRGVVRAGAVMRPKAAAMRRTISVSRSGEVAMLSRTCPPVPGW